MIVKGKKRPDIVSFIDLNKDLINNIKLSPVSRCHNEDSEKVWNRRKGLEENRCDENRL